ncbi:MAG: hypothetical protein HRT44_12320 [Bdellovibrionales bacterium]|nr:hypothetical protein [Bdellovibrionales bacterium]NQZ20023.1 hypothetical protein [Bdellovibrionales bacterium]
MKTLILSFAVLFSISSFAQTPHSFSQKTKDIVKAVDVGSFSTEKEYIKMLNTSCKRSQCSSLESIKIKEAGQNIVLCNMNYLKRNNLKNSDATNICNHKQPIFGCDSNATPLLRKMCYSANKYSLSLWKKKEFKIKKRFPASQ